MEDGLRKYREELQYREELREAIIRARTDKSEEVRLAKIGAEAVERCTGKRPYFFQAVLVGAIVEVADRTKK